MDKITKALNKLPGKERKKIKHILKKINERDFDGMDIKKLKGHSNIFRARKGEFRIIFIRNNENIAILSIEKKSDRTYKSF